MKENKNCCDHIVCKYKEIVYRKYNRPLFLYSKEELNSHINKLNFLSNIFGCIVHQGIKDSKSAVIIFAGNLERFAMLTIARDLKCKVIYIQDTISWWYDGSYILPNIIDIIEFVKSETEGMKCTFFGQSSGGYAALVAGGMIADADVIACSPQTFSDMRAKAKIYFSSQLNINRTPSYLFDILEIYKNTNRTGMSAVIVGGCEYSNPYQSHFWVDHLHAFRLCEVASVNIFVSSTSRHSIIFRNSTIISSLLTDIVNLENGDIEAKRQIIKVVVDQIKES